MWIEQYSDSFDSDLGDKLPIFPTSIGKSCPNLKRLDVYSLHWHWDESAHEAWEKAGETLESLAVSCPLENGEVIGHIQKYCRNLKSLDLSGHEEVANAIVRCIVSYGNQLERVTLYMCNNEQILAVKNSCPNARIGLTVLEGELDQSLKIVGNQLEKITVLPDYFSEEKTREPFNWSVCTNIEEARFYFDATVPDIQCFLKYPRHNLKKIVLWMDGDKKKVQAAISLIGKGTGSLEEFGMTCKDAAIGTFKEFVRANSSLRKVNISLSNSERENLVAVDTVRTFLLSPSLSKISVNSGKNESDKGIAEMKRICRLAKCRRVWITVFDEVYLY